MSDDERMTEPPIKGAQFLSDYSDRKAKCAACRFIGKGDKPLYTWTTISLKSRTQSSVDLHLQCAGTYFFIHSEYMFQIADESKLVTRGAKG